MLPQKSLIDVIREKVWLPNPDHKGWANTKCMACNDHSPRGGFYHDGIYTSYSCFNCGVKFKYEEGSGKLSRNAKDILADFGITREDLRELTSSIFLAQKEEKNITLESLTKVSLFTREVAFPDRTKPLLSEGNELLQEPILEYLISRKIDPLEHQLYYSLDSKMLRRVIIPFWRDNKLIYWQARSIDKDVKPRYLNCVVTKEAVMFNYDQLYSYDDAPLFITEGVFDALAVNGMAIMGAGLNEAKIEVLKRSKRRKIFVVDRDEPGEKLAKSALDNGWEITFVDVRANDINDSIIKFGRPFTAYSLLKNATSKHNKLQSYTNMSMGFLEARLRRRY
jgi:hypothetical protein